MNKNVTNKSGYSRDIVFTKEERFYIAGSISETDERYEISLLLV